MCTDITPEGCIENARNFLRLVGHIPIGFLYLGHGCHDLCQVVREAFWRAVCWACIREDGRLKEVGNHSETVVELL